MTLATLDQLGWWVIFIFLFEIGLLLGLIVWALLQAAHRPAPVLLVMSITMVTVLILMVYVITREAEVLTLAGVPIGALVTAATGVFKGDAMHSEAIEALATRMDALYALLLQQQTPPVVGQAGSIEPEEETGL